MKNNRNARLGLFIGLGIFIILFFALPFFSSGNSVEIKYSEFYNQLEANNIEKVEVNIGNGSDTVSGEFKKPYTPEVDDAGQTGTSVLGGLGLSNNTGEYSSFTAEIPKEVGATELTSKIKENGLDVKVNKYVQPISFGTILTFALPILLFYFFYRFYKRMMRDQEKSLNVKKSKGKPVKSNVTFNDVAGYKEEKKELEEIVDFLKNPKKYTEIGARVPKGVLLVGPPGTGKTLLAKAVAGEAGVNFIMQSGSEFVEMFVGVGASRARELFKEAKKNKPAIIFIDEIDAIGRHRGSGTGGGNDEREQTLNQILIEMDGFVGNSGVVVMAATNRVDVLDPALLRPGRFDRQVQVNLPNLKEREEILGLHASRRKVAADVDMKEVAKNTSGFSGAQLENVMNESAIMAVRNGKSIIDKKEISEGIDRVIMGASKKSRKYTPEDKKIISYHETGHVMTGLELEDADAIQKVTIIPRGEAAGYAMHAPKEDRFNYTKDHLLEKIVGLLAGRAGEEIFCNVQTAGASNDLERATMIARDMVVKYGMTDLGMYQYILPGDDERGYTNKRYSEEAAVKIDKEINRILSESYEKAKSILTRRKEDVILIAEALMEVETLERKDIDYLLKYRKLPEPLENTVEEFHTDVDMERDENSI